MTPAEELEAVLVEGLVNCHGYLSSPDEHHAQACIIAADLRAHFARPEVRERLRTRLSYTVDEIYEALGLG